MNSNMPVNTLASTFSTKILTVRNPLRFVNGFVTIRGVKYYSQSAAMKIWGITRPTYYKYVKDRRILRMEINDPIIEGERRFVVSDRELARVKAIIEAGWVRGKAKLPKPKKSVNVRVRKP